MESQPQNPEFRNNPENFYPWKFCKGFIGKGTFSYILFVKLSLYNTIPL